MQRVKLSSRMLIMGASAALSIAVGLPAAHADQEVITIHEVERGDWLTRLAAEFYGDASLYGEIYRANPHLESPDMVRVGDELKIPVVNREKENGGKPITLATSDNYHPYADSDLKGGGMVVRMAVDTFEKAGYESEVVFLDSWTDVRQKAEEAEYDVALPYVKTKERQVYFDYSEALYPMQSQIFVSVDSSLPGDWDRSALVGSTACKPKGYYTSDLRKLIDAGEIALMRGASVADCLKRVKAGTADFLPVNRYTGWATVMGSDELSETEFAHLARPLAEAPLHIMVSKDNPDRRKILRDFNEALDVAREAGRIQAIREDALDDYEKKLPDAAQAAVQGERKASLRVADERGDRPVLYTANNYEPFADDSLPRGGMSSEVVRWAANKAFDNPPYIEIQSGWPKVAEGALSGEADGAFPYVRTKGRLDRGFIFSEPLHGMQVEVFVRKDDPLEQYSGLADLYGRTVCKPKGYWMKDVREMVDGGAIDVLEPKPDSSAGCMEALKAGDADFVSMNPHVAQGAIESSDASTDEIRSAGPHTTVNLHVMAADSEEGRAFIKQLNQELVDMANRGTLRAIEERHRRMYKQ